MKIYFVWIKNQYGLPEGQIWFGKQLDGNGKERSTLTIREISVVETALGVTKLSERYPYEVKE